MNAVRKAHVMNDLETMDTVASAVILSIGAVTFDAKGVGENEFYLVINRQSCIDAGLTESESTKIWWAGQAASNPAAAVILDEANSSESIPLKDALIQLSQWFNTNTIDGKLWGNGADFDNPILNYAYRAVGLEPPWKPYNGRCYRTIKSIFNGVRMTRTGTHHNALDDARNQAEHLIQIVSGYQIPLN